MPNPLRVAVLLWLELGALPGFVGLNPRMKAVVQFQAVVQRATDQLFVAAESSHYGRWLKLAIAAIWAEAIANGISRR